MSSATFDEPSPANFPRLARLISKFADSAYRHTYVAIHTRQFLARQMRAFRGERSQAEFGKILGKPQSVVSRLEDPHYGKWTLQTLFEVARKLDRAVIVRIVDYSTFLKWSDDMSDSAVSPSAFSESDLNDLIAEMNAASPPEPGDVADGNLNYVGTANDNDPAVTITTTTGSATVSQIQTSSTGRVESAMSKRANG